MPAAGAGEAEVDSLVWYAEQLERDLAQCEIVHEAVEDSLKLRIELLGWELEEAEDRERKWYHDPRLHFLFGAAAATLVMSATLNLSF